MKRIWIGIGILLGLLIIGILVMQVTDQRLGVISEQLQQAAREPDWGSAVALARKAQDHWEKHWYLSAIVSDHTNIDEIDGVFTQLEVYQQHRDSTAHGATCAWLSEAIRDLEENHRFTWWNLL